MLAIVGTLTKTRVEHTEPALPAAVLVPNRREAIEALQYVQQMSRTGSKSVLVDGEVVNADTAIDVLRRFVLTR